MIISDLSYLETATELKDLEGGIASYSEFAFFAQRIQGINTIASSSPNGTIVGSQVVDVRTLTFGGLAITF